MFGFDDCYFSLLVNLQQSHDEISDKCFDDCYFSLLVNKQTENGLNY